MFNDLYVSVAIAIVGVVPVMQAVRCVERVKCALGRVTHGEGE